MTVSIDAYSRQPRGPSRQEPPRYSSGNSAFAALICEKQGNTPPPAAATCVEPKRKAVAVSCTEPAQAAKAMTCVEPKKSVNAVACVEPKQSGNAALCTEPKQGANAVACTEPKHNMSAVTCIEPKDKAQTGGAEPQPDAGDQLLAAMSDALMRFSSMSTLLRLGQSS